ncbi:MAG: Elongation factor Ts [Verrucomicrobia subdivision 3 bacterium]|nr:Elongation factor Ts [Limisphaerales bacterium]MCS1417354.1 Elongation factor Ts [Limisphaerales bacterium]
MAEITATAVGKLRAMTNAGFMDCKKALTETGGDLEAAVDVLRKKGVASAAKKAGRSANEGVIAHYISPDSKSGTLVEVNCETDFVAKNETFREFCNQVAKALVKSPDTEIEEMRAAQVAKIGENIQIGRRTRMDVSGTGMIAAYIHTGAKIGVLVEVGANNASSIGDEQFAGLVKDITLQIAAANPVAVRRDEIDPAIVRKEKEIAEDQARGKPPQAIAKIIEGKLAKYYQNTCLEDQGFIRQNGEVTVKEHIASVGKEMGDEFVVRRFLRFQIGEGEQE